ncbi:MAG TPA: hypothetical protein VGR02_03930 [Thermoanaerobaculia bacterium]|jgi:hypothetical protein|nr:hypothetical protein [Thermoanaerobaculia bacterium]
MLGLVAVALLAVGAFEPFYVRMFLADRSRMAASLRELPYSKAPGLRRFYAEVARRTPPGSRIAIAARWTGWEGGYEYVYARALYPLAGRQIHALTGPRPSSAADMDFIAAYRSSPAVPGFETVWQSEDGTLLRRTR